MKKSRRLIIFASIIVVVIVLAVGAALIWSSYQASKSNGQNNTGNNSGQSTTTPQQVAQTTTDAADKLAYEGNVSGGVQKLNDAIKGTTNTQEQFLYYSSLATLLLNNNQLPDALAAAKSAYELNKVSGSAALVGQIAAQMGDKTTAATYYQYAIDHIDPNDPYAKTDQADYQATINSLKGGQ
jgi:predicted negative regulator of RcsB-dependent stress response